MNKVLIVDASKSDRRIMAGLLVKSGYEPIAVETMEAAKEEMVVSPCALSKALRDRVPGTVSNSQTLLISRRICQAIIHEIYNQCWGIT